LTPSAWVDFACCIFLLASVNSAVVGGSPAPLRFFTGFPSPSEGTLRESIDSQSDVQGASLADEDI
jgi:hypothetical protein